MMCNYQLVMNFEDLQSHEILKSVWALEPVGELMSSSPNS